MVSVFWINGFASPSPTLTIFVSSGLRLIFKSRYFCFSKGERQDLVEFFRSQDTVRNQLNSVYLRRAPDLAKVAKKFETSKAAMFDACKTYEFVEVLSDIKELLESVEKPVVKKNFTTSLETAIEDFEPFVELIKKTVDFNRLNDEREPMIKAEFDEELKELDEQLQEIEQRANRLYSSVCKKFDLDPTKCKLEANSECGYTFRVTKSMEKHVRNLKGIKLVNRAKKTEIRFVTDALSELSSEYINVMSSYDAQQKELVKKVLEVVSKLNILVISVNLAKFPPNSRHL